MKYGIIAGNGRFPILALETARNLGHEVVVVGIKEEASPDVEALASRCHWISLGQLGKLIEVLHEEGVSEVMMAGQVLERIVGIVRHDKHASAVTAVTAVRAASGDEFLPPERHAPTTAIAGDDDDVRFVNEHRFGNGCRIGHDL